MHSSILVYTLHSATPTNSVWFLGISVNCTSYA